MGKLATVLYGVTAYLLFLATWAYLIGFVGGLWVPKTVDSGPATQAAVAIPVDLGLLALFFAHHSVLARWRVKQALKAVIPPVIERSTYVLVASGMLALVFWQWRPMPEVVWQVEGPVKGVLLGVFWLGVLVTLTAANMIDGLEVFGVRQVLVNFQGRLLKTTPFTTPGLYRLVRHPMMTGILLTLWAAPTMSRGHLLLAATMSAYVVLAVKYLEERDLRRAFGEAYERYQESVPMLLPHPVRRRREEAKSVTPSI